MSWTRTSDRLTRAFHFADFRTAWRFLTAVAAEADRSDHHPGIWNEYGYVRLELSSHDAGNRVTERDERLARAIDAIADEFPQESAPVSA
ncbi:MAG: 4a-hydroxytetrahydrobiopterin dehydratase [Hymenobacteraceae bacterium]|nr:4a-hydroxytetrahydrobiopterin dehydratase [Hymenobacteraceae bacterium]